MKRVLILAILLAAIFTADFIYISSPRSTEQITGAATGATGSAQVSFRILSGCSIAVKEGWNLISICSNLTNKTVQSIFKDIDGDYRYVLEWNESQQSFEVFSPLAAQNPFAELSENKSYFIYITSLGSTINTGGNLFGDVEIPLFPGWNSPIYPYEFETDILGYLESINNSYRYVMVWNASSQKFLIFSPLAAQNDFENISSGEGQFIYISDPGGATLKYNKSALN